MEKIKAKLTPPPEAAAICRKLIDNGFKAYFCGGCVRDYLMGVTPKDWDITTYAIPEDIERIFPKTFDVGRAFGVMIVVDGGKEFEVATLRSDSVFSDGRRPNGVFFTNTEEDVNRRDFTVNGLLYDPVEEVVLDYVGGVKDIEKGIIKAIGKAEQRFKEDYLRMLRAVRFAANLDFEIEKKTFSALKKNAPCSKELSNERIADELKKMLTRGNAGNSIRLLDEAGVLIHILPEIERLKGVEQPKQFHPEGDVWIHTMLMLDQLPAGADSRLAMAVLLHDVGKPDTIKYEERIKFHSHDTVGADIAEDILRRLKFSNAFIKDVVALVRGHMRMAALKKMRVSKLRRTLQDPLFPLHLELHRLDCLSSHRKMEIYEFGKQEYEREKSLPEPVADIITGKDLIAMGYKPSRRFSKILAATQDEYLEGEIKNREEAIEFVRKNFLL